MFEGVPTMYLYLLDHLGALETDQRPDVSSLTRCTVGGQTMAVAKMRAVEELLGCPLIELWGMTELAGLGTTHPSYGVNVHGSIGVALPYTEVRIAATDGAAVTLARGEIGELMVRGPLVMQGYFGNPAATAEAIEPDGWLHTGDVAYQDEAGHVFVVDRKKDMILTAGYNVYPAEIERVLSAHPAVSMVAVGAVPDETKGEIAKAYVVLRPGQEATADELIENCRAELAAYKVPRAVQFVADLPKTSTGKLMRRALRDLDS
jgi:long-chain acyl-CoA synthetase